MTANHGTYGYQLGCRCDKCRAEIALAARRYRARKKAGLVQKVSAREARQHLRALRAMGFTWNAIDKAAGVKGAQRIGTGETRWIEPKTADVLLGITLSDLKSTHGVLKPSGETFQQIAEIQAAGYSLNWIEGQIGYIPRTSKDRCPRVWPATEKRVQALHDQLWKDNANQIRKVCKCYSRLAPEPEVQANRYAKRAERERRKKEAA